MNDEMIGYDDNGNEIFVPLVEYDSTGQIITSEVIGYDDKGNEIWT